MSKAKENYAKFHVTMALIILALAVVIAMRLGCK